MSAKEKLKELGLSLPQVAKPAAAYVPAVKDETYIFTSGQVPFVEGRLKYTGLLGRDLSVEEGYEAAKICCLNCLAAVADLAGDLDRVARIVKVTGFVASAPEFRDQHLVLNGASELLGQVFGPAGQHARSAVGMSSLPLNAPVEVEMIVKLKAS